MAAEHSAARNQAHSQETAKRKREWATFWALVAAAAAAIITLIVSHSDNRAIIREAEDTEHRQLRAYVGPIHNSFRLTTNPADCEPSAPSTNLPHTIFCTVSRIMGSPLP
jgi:hypothetical protein